MEKVIFLKPHISHTIWGGSLLRDEFGIDEPGDDIGECWGVSAHPSGESRACGGEFDGMNLSEIWTERRDVFGNVSGDRFPLLVKLIDAKADLSIQVHPDDEYARQHENGSLGKSECWYILNCPEDGEIVLGHNAKTSDELCKMIDDGMWNDLIRVVRVHPGDVISIEPGTVHAIKAGICLLETQQSSDITYRLYDYDRLQNGKPRMLHLAQSKDVIKVPSEPEDSLIKSFPETDESGIVFLTGTDHYKVYRVNVIGDYSFSLDEPFLNATVIKGSGCIFGKSIKKGDNMIITHEGVKNIELTGDMELIVSGI